MDRTLSVCPVCKRPAAATLLDRAGRIFQRTECEEHGVSDSMIFSDVSLYRLLDEWNDMLFPASVGVPEPPLRSPASPGLQVLSANAPTLAVIDITNHCNLRCPLCFAETNGHGSHYFLVLDQIRPMLSSLLERRPTPCRSIQFSGGEPTLHPQFFDILRTARDMGFTHIQVATNGRRFAEPEFVFQCEEAGLHTLYLQFDGMDDRIYRKLRGRPLLEEKIRVVENVTRTNMRLVLVPTIAAGINVDQIGPIFYFALRHSRHVTGISIQPAADTGRVDVATESVVPFNLADMAMEFSRQTNLTRYPEDWFPLSAVSMISCGLSNARNERLPAASCDAHCSLGTYFYIDHENRAHCLNGFLNLREIFRSAGGFASDEHQCGLKRRISQLRQFQLLNRCFDRAKAPRGLTFKRVLQGLDGWEDKSRGRASDWARRGFNGMFVAGMHFMDHHDYNFRRLRRCIIQYVTTDSRLIPFCSYNSGARLRTVEESARGAGAVRA